MFDEIEEDEREIRRLQRGELFRRPKPKLPEQQGDVMERRDDLAVTMLRNQIDLNIELEAKYTALVEQRDRLVEVLRNLIRQLPNDERLADYNLDEAEHALATIAQADETLAKGGSEDLRSD